MADGNFVPPLKVAIIGSGFGGLGMGVSLKKARIENFAIFEKADDVGGTWRENTYPGCGCDVPSHFYSFSFERDYPWQWRYAKQPEIYAYARHVAEKYGLRPHLRLGMTLQSARFDEARALWQLQFANGEQVEAETLISAVGQLHQPAYPNIPGRESFGGVAMHSAHWNHDFDLTGKTVAVIGTGASAVQFVPEIAPKVKQMHVFQRSPGWTFPKVDSQFSKVQQWLIDHIPGVRDLDRLRIFGITELLAAAYNGNAVLEKLVTAGAKLQAKRQVKDPALRAKLTPDFAIGCKRILLTSAWLPALTRANVEVVDDGISEITATGVRTADGTLREVDAILYGTGFKATQFLTPMKVTGKGGVDLHSTWTHGADAYYGMAVAGFPNFFMLYGPNTNVGSGSIIFMLERQQRYITQLLQARARNDWATLEVKAEVQKAYADEMQRRSQGTTYSSNCQSWYKTAEGRNTNNWVGSQMEFARRLKKPDLADYVYVRRPTAVAA